MRRRGLGGEERRRLGEVYTEDMENGQEKGAERQRRDGTHVLLFLHVVGEAIRLAIYTLHGRRHDTHLSVPYTWSHGLIS